MKPLGVALSALVGFAVGWLCCMRFQPEEAPAIGSAHSDASATTQQRVAVLEPPVDMTERAPVERDPAPAPAAPTLRETLATLDQMLDAALAGPLTEESFRERYSGLSIGQLQAIEGTLKGRMEAETKRISDELLARGELEAVVAPPGEKPVLVSASHDEPIATVAFRMEPIDGGTNLQVAKIHPAEHPELRALQMNFRWVASQWRHMEHQ